MVRDENQGGSLRNISKSGSARGHSKRDGPDVRRQGDGISLVVQWLRLCASNAGYAGSIPGRGIKMPQAILCGQKIKKKKKEEEREREERAWRTTSESDCETLHTVCTDPSSALGTPVC